MPTNGAGNKLSKPPQMNAARRKIIDTYVLVGSYVKTAQLCDTHADHARRVVREHPDYHQQRLEEQREEDRAWELEQRETARAVQAANNAWVSADEAMMRARLDELIQDTDPRVALAALKEKRTWAMAFASSSDNVDDERLRRVLDAIKTPDADGPVA